MVNKVHLLGPVYSMKSFDLPSGKKMIKFSLKTWFKAGEIEKKQYHSVTAFGSSAETIFKYWEDGKKIFIEGYLDNYKDKDSNAYKTDVIVEQFSFISSN
jgi:single-stranded DNA-binding protein